MPNFQRDDVTIYYEEHGSGYPLLVIAPGGMNSTVAMWAYAAINPLAVFADDFRLIAMDQRNAGASTGPLDTGDPWGSMVSDQLALLDHLGVEQFLVMGCCIGGSYILKLIEQAPSRVVAAVLEQPIGVFDDNAHLFAAMWRAWGDQLVQERVDIDAATAQSFGSQMWQRDFVVSVPKDVVRACPTPLLVLPGIDDYHPSAAGREIVALAPHAEVFEPWKDTAEHTEQAVVAIRRFLQHHTPG